MEGQGTGLELGMNDSAFLILMEKINKTYPNRLIKNLQKEQIRFRMYICSKCLESKRCSFCKCNPVDVISEPYSCNHGKIFPDFLSEEKWNDFKTEHNLIIK